MNSFRRSKLDTFGMSMLAVGGIFFLVSATCFLISLAFITDGVPLPLFSLLDIGVLAGGIGMAVIPFFVLTMVINNIRERRRNSQTGNDIDEAHSERGAASGSGPDQ